MDELTTPSRKPKYLRRLHAAANVLAAYLTLTDDDRHQFEQFLALQVYGDPETDSYLHLACAKYVADSERVLHNYEGHAIYDAWSAWNSELKKSHLADIHRREAIKDLLSILIQHKTEDSSLTELAILEAAEKTMSWASWDEVYLTQLHNSGTTTAAYNAERAERGLANQLDGDNLGRMARLCNL